jgi:hypothetical protein
MVAIINNTSSLRQAVNYNEQKVKQGKANGLVAVNYPLCGPEQRRIVCIFF